MQVCEIMRHHPVVCFPEDSAEVAARTMAEQNIGILPVVRRGTGGKLVGIVTDRDICMRVVGEARNPRGVKVSECMTSSPVCCGPRDDIHYAMLLMREHQVRRIPVVDADYRVGGLLSFGNLLNSQCSSDALVDTLRQACYPANRSLMVTKSKEVSR